MADDCFMCREKTNRLRTLEKFEVILCDDCFNSLDDPLCCHGWECGCRGSSNRDQLMHYLRQPAKANYHD